MRSLLLAWALILAVPLPAQVTPGDNEPQVFAARIASFWRWFSKHEGELREQLGRHDPRATEPAPLVAELQERLGQLLPRLHLSVGRLPPDGKQWTLTLSALGDRTGQLLGRCWLDHAPQLAGWRFFLYKQPGRIQGIQIGIAGKRFAARDFRVSIATDPSARKLDLEVHHPAFRGLELEAAVEVCYLLLDEAIGEAASEVWLRRVRPVAERRAEAKLTMETIGDEIRRILSEHGWDVTLEPDRLWTAYQGRAETGAPGLPLRGDIIAGTTRHMDLLTYWSTPTEPDPNPAPETGASFAFVSLTLPGDDPRERLAARRRVEEALQAAFQSSGSARTIGSALGLQRCYVDLLILDEPRALADLRDVTAKLAAVEGATLYHFAAQRRKDSTKLK